MVRHGESSHRCCSVVHCIYPHLIWGMMVGGEPPTRRNCAGYTCALIALFLGPNPIRDILLRLQVAPGQASAGFLGVGVLFHAGVLDRGESEFCQALHHPYRPRRLCSGVHAQGNSGVRIAYTVPYIVNFFIIVVR